MLTILELIPLNLPNISHQMDNGVSYEELSDMITEDRAARRSRVFVKSGDVWAFVDQVRLEALMHSVLILLDH